MNVFQRFLSGTICPYLSWFKLLWKKTVFVGFYFNNHFLGIEFNLLDFQWKNVTTTTKILIWFYHKPSLFNLFFNDQKTTFFMFWHTHALSLCFSFSSNEWIRILKKENIPNKMFQSKMSIPVMKQMDRETVT